MGPQSVSPDEGVGAAGCTGLKIGDAIANHHHALEPVGLHAGAGPQSKAFLMAYRCQAPTRRYEPSRPLHFLLSLPSKPTPILRHLTTSSRAT